MTIENNWYVAKCISMEYPMARTDANTFYLPKSVKKKDEMYEYEEYRFNIPINYDIPREIIDELIIKMKNIETVNLLTGGISAEEALYIIEGGNE